MLSIIIKEIDEHGKLSYWEIYKILRDKYKIKCDKSNIRYHLEKLRKKGFIGKEEGKYFLIAPVLCIDGVVLFTKPPAVVNCPFYKQCKCDFRDGCQFFDSLPKEIKEFYIKLIKKEERKD